MANNTLIASDYFLSGSLAAGWGNFPGSQTAGQTTVTGGHVTQPTALNGAYGQLWTALGSLADQTVEVTANLTNENGTYLSLYVRWSVMNALGQGYFASITQLAGNPTLTLQRADNGVNTTLGSPVISLTITPGDVWAFQAAGAAFSIYQNYKRIFYYYDATYTTGYSGYQLYSTTNVTHTQVSGFRLYNAVQQDGIWTKQGIVLANLSTDMNGTLPGEGIGEPSVLYEGNAQILSGNVFKMWCGTNGASTGIFYAESFDGIIWSRRAGLVVSPNIPGHLIKVGSTYYLYAQVPGGNGNVGLYTATDGITFSLVNANVFSASGSGWDTGSLWDFTPIAVITGTWNAIYVATGAGAKPSMGLATSPDGVTWTRYVSNPVLVGRWITSAFALVGSTWYFWLGGNSPGQLGSGNVNWDPNEIVRYSTPDFKTWTPAGHSLRRGSIYEGVNTGNGQIFPSAILNVGNTTYLYNTPACADGAQPNVYQVSVATVATPISNLVTLNENATAQTQSDAFPGSGSLSGNWITPTGVGALTIASANHVQAINNTQNCVAIYTGASFPATQYCEITITALVTSGDFIVLICRGQSSGGFSGYGFNLSGPAGTRSATSSLNKYTNNVNVNIGPLFPMTPQLGDVLRFSVTTSSGGFPLLSAYQNGFLLAQAEDYSNAWLTGFPGIGIFNTEATLTNTQISSFAGGNAGIPPPFGGGSGDLGPGFDFSLKI